MSEIVKLSSQPFIIGADFRSCSLSVRDRLFVTDSDIPNFLKMLRKKGLREAFVLSTCDRIEVLGLHAFPEQLTKNIKSALAYHGGFELAELEGQIYQKFNKEAINHIFSVASSLESQIVGEPQVLGQIKACHRIARDAKMISGPLERLLQIAYRVAKRVRTETAIGEWSVSNPSVASRVARGLFGDLRRVSVILIGVENIGAIFARQFQFDNIEKLTIYHPNNKRSEALARELNCKNISSLQLQQSLIDSDIVVCAMGSSKHVLTSDMIRASLIKRKNKPQFILDLGVPGDVEPSVARIDDAFVYDAKDLESLAFEGKLHREQAASHARNIISHEIELYIGDQTERKVSDTISALRASFEKARLEVLKEHSDASRATQLLINRLLDKPLRMLRENKKNKEIKILDVEELVQSLFDLKGQNHDKNKNK